MNWPHMWKPSTILSSFSHPCGAEPPYVRSHRAVSQRHISITAKTTGAAQTSWTIPLLINWQVTYAGSAFVDHSPFYGTKHRNYHARTDSVIHLPPVSSRGQHWCWNGRLKMDPRRLRGTWAGCAILCPWPREKLPCSIWVCNMLFQRGRTGRGCPKAAYVQVRGLSFPLLSLF